jgi:hypothetical protein
VRAITSFRLKILVAVLSAVGASWGIKEFRSTRPARISGHWVGTLTGGDLDLVLISADESGRLAGAGGISTASSPAGTALSLQGFRSGRDVSLILKGEDEKYWAVLRLVSKRSLKGHFHTPGSGLQEKIELRKE